jgi:hypothetical protein
MPCKVRIIKNPTPYPTTSAWSPEKYVYEDEHISTIVSEFLSLSEKDEGSIYYYYDLMVNESKEIAPNLLPFAVDGG